MLFSPTSQPFLPTARITIRTFSIRRNEDIACHVTLRGELAEKVLAKVGHFRSCIPSDVALSKLATFFFAERFAMVPCCSPLALPSLFAVPFFTDTTTLSSAELVLCIRL